LTKAATTPMSSAAHRSTSAHEPAMATSPAKILHQRHPKGSTKYDVHGCVEYDVLHSGNQFNLISRWPPAPPRSCTRENILMFF
jgi:hypothetical protein